MYNDDGSVGELKEADMSIRMEKNWRKNSLEYYSSLLNWNRCLQGERKPRRVSSKKGFRELNIPKNFENTTKKIIVNYKNRRLYGLLM